MNVTETAHERRMTAVLRLVRAKDRFSRVAADYLLGRELSSAEIRTAAEAVDAARSELTAMDAGREGSNGQTKMFLDRLRPHAQIFFPH